MSHQVFPGRTGDGVPFAESSRHTQSALAGVLWAAWFNSRPAALRHLCLAAVGGDRHAGLQAASQSSGEILKLMRLRELAQFESNIGPDVVAIVDALTDGLIVMELPPVLSRVVRASDAERTALVAAAREGVVLELSRRAQFAVVATLAFLVGVSLDAGGTTISPEPEVSAYLAQVASSLALAGYGYQPYLARWLATFDGRNTSADASWPMPGVDAAVFVEALPRFLGMGVRSEDVAVAFDGRLTVRYWWDDGLVAAVTASPDLRRWMIEDFGPTGECHNTFIGRDYQSVADQYAEAALGPGVGGSVAAWLGQRMRPRHGRSLLIAPSTKPLRTGPPDVATARVIATIGHGAQVPRVPKGVGSGTDPIAMPLGPRPDAAILEVVPPGRVVKRTPVGIAEYAVPAIDAQDLVEDLIEHRAVFSDVPIFVLLAIAETESSLLFGRTEAGTDVLLHSGKADLTWVARANARRRPA